jgi:predicted GNAT family acetyltransferase
MTDNWKIARQPDPVSFLDSCRAHLFENEPMNCLGIGIVNTLIRNPATYPTFHLWTLNSSSEDVRGCAWWTPPMPIGLSTMPIESARALADFVLNLDVRPTAVVGPKEVVQAFADEWIRVGQQVCDRINQRIFKCTEPISPSSVGGRMIVANDTHLDLLTTWNHCFGVECNLNQEASRARQNAEASILNRSRRLWILNSEIVSMAGSTGETSNGARIGAVYTPPQHRGKGFGSMLVYQLTMEILQSGKAMSFLYTDLSNPTSNSIYQKMGYKPVGDSLYLRFE